MNTKKLVYRIFIWGAVSITTLLLLGISFVYLFKDKIIAASITEINKHLNSKVDIHPKINLSFIDKFPQVSLGFSDVKIYESIPESNKLLGKVEKLYLTFNILNILDGNYIINKLYVENGTFNLIVDKNGINNYTLLKSTGDSSKGKGGIDLTNIYIKNILVNYSNEINEQFYEVLSQELEATLALKNNTYKISLTGPQVVKNIQIHKSDYFRNKALSINSTLIYDDTEKKLTIEPTTFLVDNSQFKIEGNYSFKNENKVAIKFSNANGDIQDLLSLLPQAYSTPFTDYKSEGAVYFNASISGIISETENAAVTVNFGCKNASFFHPDYQEKITDATFYGSFTNGNQKNLVSSSLKLENMRFIFDEKLIQADFLYKNFENPFVAFEALGSVKAPSLLKFYKIASIKSATGLIDFDIKFSGLLNDLKTKEGHSKINAEGELLLKDLSIIPSEIPVSIKKCNGSFLFNKNDIAISDFSASIGKSDIEVSGLLKNLFGALLLKNGRMLAEVELKSNYFDVAELLSFQPLEENTDTTSYSIGEFPFLEKYLLKVEIDIKKINYKKVVMDNFKGSVTFDQPLLKTENVTFQIAKGEVQVNSTTNFKTKDKIETTIKADLSKIKIDSLMFMFDDFGQGFITFKNLKGNFTGRIETALNWDYKGEINTNSIIANIDCSIENGELIDFEPMQNLARFIDAQELTKIKFSELKNKLFIENRKISFPEMQIISNVSDISISGTHTFDNDMDYKLAVPLKNLKKHKIDKDASFGAIEEDASKGSTLFLTIKGNVDNYKISYDTKRTKGKISENLKKEKMEFLNLFKKKEEAIQETIKPNQEEFFDFDD